MTTLFEQTRFMSCRTTTRKVREVREECGDDTARAVCVGSVDGFAAQLVLMCGPQNAAEFFYRVADHIVARNADRIQGNQSSGLA